MSETTATAPSSAAVPAITSRIVPVPVNATGTRIDMMLDIETFSTEPDALILSVGAVLFDPFGTPGEIFREWHMPLRLEQPGSRTSLDTVMWWLGQSEAAKALLALRAEKPCVSIRDLYWALHEMYERVAATKGGVWGNSPSFDCVILREAFKRDHTLEGTPWPFWVERCYRTYKAEFARLVTMPPNELGHDALSDAKHQAIGVQLINGALNAKRQTTKA